MPGGSTHAKDGPAHCLGLQVAGAQLEQKGWVADEDCSSPGLGANRTRITLLFRSMSRIRWKTCATLSSRFKGSAVPHSCAQ